MRLAPGFVVLLALTAPALVRADPPAARADRRERPLGTEPFAPDVYRARRAHLLGLMKKGVGLLLSSPAMPDTELQDPDFLYLTGLASERDGALLLSAEEPGDDREILYLAPARPERDRFSGGYRALLPNRTVETRTGFARISRYDRLGPDLATRAERDKQLHYFGPAVPFDREVPPALDIYEKTVKRTVGARLDDSHLLLGRMRMVKEPRELERIARATDITVAGHLEAMRRVHPGMREWELKQIVEDAFRKGGARRLAYGSIVGAGPDGCVLHYAEDDRVIEDGELVLIDAGAEFDHYATDVTRTFPASGKFTPEQRKIYEAVLRAQNAALAKVRPGVTWLELQKTAEKVIADAGYYEYFVHRIGHHVGLQVHDLGEWTYREPIAEGSVITIEPGIYIPEKNLGVRIEDTVVVTKSGARSLSAALPRDVDAIEKLMASKRAP
jgi:Xaa-Pro aminopeptidase